jgi:hypothetical protein
MEHMSDGTQQKKVSYEVQQTNKQECAKRYPEGTEMLERQQQHL